MCSFYWNACTSIINFFKRYFRFRQSSDKSTSIKTQYDCSCLNMILFVLVYFGVGKKFAMKTLFSALVFPFLLEFFSRFTFMEILNNDMFLAQCWDLALVLS